MATQKKDLREVEERQSSFGDPKEQQETAPDIGNNNMQNIKPPDPLLGEKAEEYLREQANIEDMPDENNQDDYDKTIEKSKK